MLSPDEERTLRMIELQIDHGDERFAEGLRTGSPCEPREYRRSRWRVVAFVAPAAVLGLVVLGAPIPIIVAASLAALLGVLAWCRRP